MWGEKKQPKNRRRYRSFLQMGGVHVHVHVRILVPSGFRLSCLSTLCANITAGGFGVGVGGHVYSPSTDIGKLSTNVPSRQILQELSRQPSPVSHVAALPPTLLSHPPRPPLPLPNILLFVSASDGLLDGLIFSLHYHLL